MKCECQVEKGIGGKMCPKEAVGILVLTDNPPEQRTAMCQDHLNVFEDFCMAMGLHPRGHHVEPIVKE